MNNKSIPSAMKYPALISLVLFFISSVYGKPQNSAEPPVNILFIIADDMSLHAGIYGDQAISTPGIDSIGVDGVVFENAFCTAPSCSPSRASILTGRYPHQLKEGGNLWGTLPISYPNYTRLLAQHGYEIGLKDKGWGPGKAAAGGYKQNPAGPSFESFEVFMAERPENTPFCFWLGSHDPHRPYAPDLKNTAQLDEKALEVPSWLPDNKKVRTDLLNYLAEVKRFDQTVQDAVALLKQEGVYNHTLIIITSDNGMPFPRAKANVYDAGSHIPLVMRWGDHFKNGTNKGRRIKALVSLVDISPTILDATGITIPEAVTGKSLLPLLTGGKTGQQFNTVFLERERHANVRKNNRGYPVRAIRTHDYLFIQNLRPDRWPAGHPTIFKSVGPFGDIDNGLAKEFLMDNRANPEFKKQVAWSLEKRPAEELYDLKKDPDQLQNLAQDPSYQEIKKTLEEKLAAWRKETQDPLLGAEQDIFDTYPYYGGRKKKK